MRSRKKLYLHHDRTGAKICSRSPLLVMWCEFADGKVSALRHHWDDKNIWLPVRVREKIEGIPDLVPVTF